MKKILTCLLSVACLLLVSCNKIDITPLEQRISDLEGAVAKLNDVAITGDYVTDVQPLQEDGAIVGYVVTFNQHGTVTVRNGKDGHDGVDGATGENGNDGAAGEDGDSWFADVTVSDDTVTFILADDDKTTFVIPRAGAAADFGLMVESRNLLASSAGQVITVPYSIKGGDAQTEISVLSAGGYEVKVEDTQIVITAPQELTDAQIWVVAENGAGKSSVVVLKIKVAEFVCPDKESWKVDATGSTIAIDFGGDATFDNVVLSQSAELSKGTLASKFLAEISEDGTTWNTVITDQALIGRSGSQRFALPAIVTARYLRISLSEPFESDLPVMLPDVDVALGTAQTGTYVEPAVVPVLKNSNQPFAHSTSYIFDTDGSGRFRTLLDWQNSASTWGITYDLALDCAGIWTCPAWGCNFVTNGKVWQTLDFAPGYYTFYAAVYGSDYAPDIDMYLVATAGEAGEDGANIADVNADGTLAVKENTLASLDVHEVTYAEVDDNKVSTLQSINFKVDTAGKVTLGWVENTRSSTYCDESGNWHYIWASFYFTGFGITGR